MVIQTCLTLFLQWSTKDDLKNVHAPLFHTNERKPAMITGYQAPKEHYTGTIKVIFMIFTLYFVSSEVTDYNSSVVLPNVSWNDMKMNKR